MSKLLVITGGTKGIGRAIVHLFADKGFDIITCARSEPDLMVLKDEISDSHPGVNLQIRRCDVTDRQSIDGFISFVKTHSSRVDVLVNNAGVFIPGALASEDEGALELMLSTNLTSAYHITRGLLPAVINSSGHIFNMCSVASIQAYPNGGSYCISKFGLYGMTKVFREELKDKGVRVTAVLPGATHTASWEGSDLPEERFIKSADVAHAVWGAYALSPQAVVEDLVIRPQLGDI